jgi:hypothetical protein
MPKMPPLMKLSREEERFLRHWMYDEVHYREGIGPAKQLQREHQAIPADLAKVIAAGFPDPLEQQAAGLGPPPTEPPSWPWASAEVMYARISDARAALQKVAKREAEEIHS